MVKFGIKRMNIVDLRIFPLIDEISEKGKTQLP